MVKKNDYLIIGVVVLALAFATGIINLGGAGAVGGAQQPSGAGGAASVSCPTIVSQTLSNTTYDADKPTTDVANTATVYLSAANGQPYPGGLSTQQLGTYDVLMTASNYFSTLVKTTTSCSATPSVVGYLKGVDTPTAALYNANQITLNTASPLAVGASGSAVAHLKLSQTVAYKHLTGESGKLCVFVNVANASEWDATQSSAVFNGVPCTVFANSGLGNAIVPAAAVNGTNKMGYICNGDFAANDGTIYDMAIKMAAASGVNPAATNNTIYYGGADYYKDSITGKVATGCGTDAGAAIQTLRSINLEVS
jgi:hypothetical protein